MTGSLIALGFNELLDEMPVRWMSLRLDFQPAVETGQREPIGSALEGLAGVAAKTQAILERAPSGSALPR